MPVPLFTAFLDPSKVMNVSRGIPPGEREEVTSCLLPNSEKIIREYEGRRMWYMWFLNSSGSVNIC